MRKTLSACFKKTILYITLISSFSLLASFSYAQVSSSDPTGGSSSDGGGTQIIGGYSLDYLNPPKDASQGSDQGNNLYMFTQSPSYDNTKIIKFFYSQYETAIGSSTPPLSIGEQSTLTTINDLLTATEITSSNALDEALEQYFPIDASGTVINFANNKVNVAQDSSQSEISALALNSLIQPLQYSSTEQETASDFIKYITNQYYPTPRIDFTTFAVENLLTGKLTQALQSQDVQQYLYLVRRMTALQSVGISNLYYLYGERVPQKTSALLPNLPDSVITKHLPQNLQQNASPLALEYWIATRRLSSENTEDGTTPWVKAIENASPATLQRETVYLLASIQQELFKQRMLTERLLATISVQQLQGAGGAIQFQLNQLQTQICKAAPFKGTNACPPQPTGPDITGNNS